MGEFDGCGGSASTITLCCNHQQKHPDVISATHAALQVATYTMNPAHNIQALVSQGETRVWDDLAGLMDLPCLHPYHSHGPGPGLITSQLLMSRPITNLGVTRLSDQSQLDVLAVNRHKRLHSHPTRHI